MFLEKPLLNFSITMKPLGRIIKADLESGYHGSPATMMQARFFDTVLGCVVGLIGGYVCIAPTFALGWAASFDA